MRIFFNNEANQINIADERFYESKNKPGVYYPSVTSILDAYFKGYGFYEWLKQVGFSADEILRKAGEQGTHVHNMIDNYQKGLSVRWLNDQDEMIYTLDEWQMFCRFIEFWTKYNPEKYVNEYSIVSDELGYGGTIDLVSKINNEIWLVDYKTSNAIHKTHELQLAAYAVAWNKLNPQYTIQRTGILWLKSQTRGEDKKGKTIQGEHWILKEFERHYEDAFELFRHTQAIWLEENLNYKPKNLIYPVEFKLEQKQSLPTGSTLF